MATSVFTELKQKLPPFPDSLTEMHNKLLIGIFDLGVEHKAGTDNDTYPNKAAAAILTFGNSPPLLNHSANIQFGENVHLLVYNTSIRDMENFVATQS